MKDKGKYKHRLAKGLCGVCGVRKPINGKVRCKQCEDQQYFRLEKFREQGLCVCGDTPVPGYKTCNKHLQYSKDYFQNNKKRMLELYTKWRLANKEKINLSRKIARSKKLKQGLCGSCGRVSIPGLTYCTECKEKSKLKYQIKKAKSEPQYST